MSSENAQYFKGRLVCLPALVFAIFTLVILLGIAFSKGEDNSTRAWSFAVVLVFSVIWIGIIYWFCTLKYQFISWFLFLLPFGIIGMFILAYWLAVSTADPDCIYGNTKIVKFWFR